MTQSTTKTVTAALNQIFPDVPVRIQRDGEETEILKVSVEQISNTEIVSIVNIINEHDLNVNIGRSGTGIKINIHQ